MFQNILEDLDRASSIEEIYPALVRLLAVVSKMLDQEDLSYAEAREMAVYLTDVRVLISELAYVGGGEVFSEKQWSMTTALKECALELEGRIKEKRNDLSRRT